MCAIFGIGFLKGHRVVNFDDVRSLLDALFSECQASGSSASGIAFTTPKEISVLKRDIPSKTMITTDAYKLACNKFLRQDSRILSIIGHTRYPTKGPPTDNNNNHPIIANNVVGVHNGMINNDETLWTTYNKIAGDSWKRAGMVDSEIIFRLLDYYLYSQDFTRKEATRKVCDLIAGSYACAYVSTRDKYSIRLFRNNTPVSLFFYPKLGLVVFATSTYYVKNATAGIDLGNVRELEMLPQTAVSIDLFNNRKVSFKLSNPGTIYRSATPGSEGL